MLQIDPRGPVVIPIGISTNFFPEVAYGVSENIAVPQGEEIDGNHSLGNQPR